MPRPPRSRAATDYTYRRAYKACIPCRQRKAKCQINSDGVPCSRCAKKQLDCRFTAKKPWARERKDQDACRTQAAETRSASRSPDEFQHMCYPVPPNLQQSGFHRMVSNTNDALDILFRSVAQRSNDAYTPASPSRQQGPVSHPEALRLWKACRFVKMGWFTAQEAIKLVDFFFANMAPYTPIITDFYSRHANHYWLITQEPTLCCVILLIASRHNVLSATGSSREQSIHNRLWQHCQHLILRIMLGQEKLSKAKTRHIGSIEALLLLAEWYPRALHFPPENDGWDSDLILAVPDERDPPVPMEERVTLKERWREDVVEPARRADRMAWMVLSSALALSHELGIFRSKPGDGLPTKDVTIGTDSTNGLDQEDSNLRPVPTTGSGPDAELYLEHLERRKRRLPPLLFVFVNQLASRIGCTSPMAGELGVEIWERLVNSAEDTEWVTFMASWVELTRLTMGVINQCFPMLSAAPNQLQGDAATLDRWTNGLAHWQNKRPRLQAIPLRDILGIEYQYVVVFINSIKLQSMVTELLSHSGPEVRHPLSSRDFEPVEQIVTSASFILRWITKLETHTPIPIQYLPISVFHRAISTSIFLLKALALGVRTVQVQECLDLLDQVSVTLQAHALDDIHLVSRYATLLKIHVERFQKSLTNTYVSAPAAGAPPVTSLAEGTAAADSEVDYGRPGETDGALPEHLLDQPVFGWSDGLIQDPDDWLSFPLDPLMAPFGALDGTGQTESGLDSTYLDLDFIWNLPP